MQGLEFLRDPAAPGVRPFYAVVGEDAYLRREALKGIGRVALGDDGDEDLAVVRFAGEQATLADVLDEVRTLPFLSRRRVVIVEGADPFVTAHRKELEAYAEAPAESGVLVLAVKSWTASTKLAKLVERVGLAIDCKSPTPEVLPRWLGELARARHGLKLEPDATHLLLELVGPEVGLLAAELEKLATYVGTRKSIHSDDVARLVGAGRLEKIWDVLDAATTGRGGWALDELDRLLASGENAVGLLSAMSFSLRKVHHAGQLRLARREVRDACREAGIYPYQVDKTQKQHAHLGPGRVAALPDLLLRADLDLKGSSTLPPRTILERLLVQLARPRLD
jgi:DNA polymerase-3 subunit delta